VGSVTLCCARLGLGNGVTHNHGGDVRRDPGGSGELERNLRHRAERRLFEHAGTRSAAPMAGARTRRSGPPGNRAVSETCGADRVMRVAKRKQSGRPLRSARYTWRRLPRARILVGWDADEPGTTVYHA